MTRSTRTLSEIASKESSNKRRRAPSSSRTADSHVGHDADEILTLLRHASEASFARDSEDRSSTYVPNDGDPDNITVKHPEPENPPTSPAAFKVRRSRVGVGQNQSHTSSVGKRVSTRRRKDPMRTTLSSSLSPRASSATQRRRRRMRSFTRRSRSPDHAPLDIATRLSSAPEEVDPPQSASRLSTPTSSKRHRFLGIKDEEPSQHDPATTKHSALESTALVPQGQVPGDTLDDPIDLTSISEEPADVQQQRNILFPVQREGAQKRDKEMGMVMEDEMNPESNPTGRRMMKVIGECRLRGYRIDGTHTESDPSISRPREIIPKDKHALLNIILLYVPTAVAMDITILLLHPSGTIVKALEDENINDWIKDGFAKSDDTQEIELTFFFTVVRSSRTDISLSELIRDHPAVTERVSAQKRRMNHRRDHNQVGGPEFDPGWGYRLGQLNVLHPVGSGNQPGPMPWLQQLAPSRPVVFGHIMPPVHHHVASWQQPKYRSDDQGNGYSLFARMGAFNAQPNHSTDMQLYPDLSLPGMHPSPYVPTTPGHLFDPRASFQALHAGLMQSATSGPSVPHHYSATFISPASSGAPLRPKSHPDSAAHRVEAQEEEPNDPYNISCDRTS